METLKTIGWFLASLGTKAFAIALLAVVVYAGIDLAHAMADYLIERPVLSLMVYVAVSMLWTLADVAEEGG